MNSPLEKEFKYFIEHHEELVGKYNGKFIVIKDCTVLASYDDELEAVRETSKDHETGTFLVQKCTPGDQDYTLTFHAGVAF